MDFCVRGASWVNISYNYNNYYKKKAVYHCYSVLWKDLAMIYNFFQSCKFVFITDFDFSS